MFTFKPQAKSNAKRFLVQTCKLENFQDYLTQNPEGQWGCYLGEDGKPVPAAQVAGVAPVDQDGHDTFTPATVQAMAAPEGTPEDAGDDTAELPADPMPAGAGAFGAFAMAQLTAPSNAAPVVEVTKPARENVTPTAGLKIQKDRETRNGVTRFSDGSVGARLWLLFDSVGKDCTVAQARAMAEVHGINSTSAQISLYRWRKFNGYTGK